MDTNSYAYQIYEPHFPMHLLFVNDDLIAQILRDGHIRSHNDDGRSHSSCI